MSSSSKLLLLLCIAIAAFVSRFVAKRLAEILRCPEKAGQWTVGLGLLSMTTVLTSWMGWLVDLWPLWSVIGLGILGYWVAQRLPRTISVRQTGWYFTFALVVSAVSAIFIVPRDYENYPGTVTLMVLLLTVCVPYLFAKLLGERLRAPEYVWKLTFVLTTIGVAAFIVAPKPEEFGVGWPPKYGVDLQGGVNLIYQFEMDSSDGGSVRGMSRSEIQKTLVQQLSRRINPSGTSDIVVRPYGTAQVEIIVPEVNQDEVALIKKLITTAGALEFRIVANNHQHAYLTTDLVKDPRNQEQDVVYDFDQGESKTEHGRWMRVAREDAVAEGALRPFKYNPVGDVIRDVDTREILALPPAVTVSDSPEIALAQYLEDEDIRDVEVLVYTGIDDPLVTGEGLGMVSAGYENLDPIVNFSLKSGRATSQFSRLTYRNRPKADEGEYSKLGILLDGELLSAPRIQSQITGRGQITGRFTQEEVNFLVEILRAGKLSTVLQKEPISENNMGAELGQSTINKGTTAIQVSLVCVVLFVVYYYRFSGVVACMALILNLLLVLALMILIKAAFTLPGLAGLILTVGMSVDANVLIFERIREELARGARLRMAIRNGFARATTTIVDANLTTLITAIVLYAIGTDQIRGFAVTLILGILMSMYTAIFCSRIVFELAERSRRFTSLKMRRLVGETKIDFIGKRAIAGLLSIVLIGTGLVAVYSRGQDIFDIDFLGGTALTMQLKEPLDVDQMEEKCNNAFETRRVRNNAELITSTSEGAKVHYTLNSLRIDGITDDTVWKLVTSVPKSQDLQELVQDVFADKLMSYSVDIGSLRTEVETEPASTETPPTDATQDESSSTSPESPEQPDKESTKPAGENPPPPPAAADNGKAVQPAGPFFVSVALNSSQQTTADPPTQPDEKKPDEKKPDESATGGESLVTTPEVVGRKTAVTLVFGESEGTTRKTGDAIAGSTLRDKIKSAAEGMADPITLDDADIEVSPLDEDRDPKWNMDSVSRYYHWEVKLVENQQVTERILRKLEDDLANTPVFHSSNTIGGKVAGDTQRLAIFAMLTSLLGIVGYIWIRFQRVVYGLAAVVALVHDVLLTLGAIAVSVYLAKALNFLQIEEFSISLPVVAAFLTIIGYSLNDTIVVFDRIREVRGKSPDLTSDMINVSINQTLSRTVLTSLTTLIVVLILYFIGGQGIHGFAYALVVGVIVGTYSSIFVASPALLWLSKTRQ